MQKALEQLTSGAFVVSAVILALFGSVVLGFAPALDPKSAALLDTAMTLVVGYWIGSSAGSASGRAVLNGLVASTVPVAAAVAAPSLVSGLVDALGPKREGT